MSFLTRPAAAIAAHRKTFFIWAVLLLAVFGLISYNRGVQARTVAALSSPNPAVREHAVQGLVQSGRLVDVLSATQDPNTDAKSPRNVASVTLRENAAVSVNTLTAAHRVSDAQAMDTLFQLRKDADKPVRDTATAGLAALGAASDANLRALVAGLRNGDPDIRAAAVDALAKVGGDKTARLVNPLTQDTETSDAAQAALQKIGAPSVPYLLADLNTTNKDLKQKVIVILGAVASPQSVPTLLQLAAAPDLSLHRLAVSSLANTILNSFSASQKTQVDARKLSADPKAQADAVTKANEAMTTAQTLFNQTRSAAPPLIAAVQNPEDDSQARTQATLALGRVGGAEAVGTLVKALGDYDALVRSAARQGVQNAGAEAVPALTVAAAAGTNADTRASAAEALGSIGSAGSVAALGELVGKASTPAAVRRAAALGMGQSGNAAFIPILVAALGDADGTVASAASDGLLAPAVEQQAVPLLISALSRPDPVPFQASQTLARMGNVAVSALQRAAASTNPRVQTWAAVTLGLTDSKDPAITTALAPLTNSTDASVKYAAQQAITRLAGI